ncbi:MAG: methyltransferase [Saprospiraceae bacterium]|nr:methyltransferase [Saprospiraceae bacterium]
MYMKHLDFFKEGIRNIRTTGTITRSSRFLCREMIRPVDFEKAKIIVELGAGDGVITRHILKNMKQDALLISFEINDKFCEILRNIHDPRLVVVEDSAEHISAQLKAHGFEQADYIISALPFLSLPKDLGINILRKSAAALKDGGIFVQMQYSLLLKHLYDSIFDKVSLRFVPINVPPAFVLVCEKSKVIGAV